MAFSARRPLPASSRVTSPSPTQAEQTSLMSPTAVAGVACHAADRLGALAPGLRAAARAGAGTRATATGQPSAHIPSRRGRRRRPAPSSATAGRLNRSPRSGGCFPPGSVAPATESHRGRSVEMRACGRVARHASSKRDQFRFHPATGLLSVSTELTRPGPVALAVSIGVVVAGLRGSRFAGVGLWSVLPGVRTLGSGGRRARVGGRCVRAPSRAW